VPAASADSSLVRQRIQGELAGEQVKKRGIRTVVHGFVQQAGTSANDQSLSTQRARNAAAYLRSRGLSGSYVVRGDGVAGPGDTDRRVNVTVRYNAGC
jgi:outer membrane protein OmpA-like peptidoglycan-associated protein